MSALELPFSLQMSRSCFMCDGRHSSRLKGPGGHLWSRTEETRGRYHLPSAHNAAAEREQSTRGFCRRFTAFISCVAGNCPRHTADRRRRLSDLHLPGFLLRRRPGCQSRCPTCSSELRGGGCGEAMLSSTAPAWFHTTSSPPQMFRWTSKRDCRKKKRT